MSTQVSIVIATYNRAEMVARCVESVLASDYMPLEVVVVNDNSPDGTAQLLQERFGDDPRVRVVTNARNLQAAASRNKGARAATGDYLFLLDDDNILAVDAIRQMVESFERDSSLGLIAPVSVHQTGEKAGLIWTLGSDFNRWTSQPKDHLPNFPIADFHPESDVYPTTYSPNAFMIRRAVFEQTNGMDEAYGIMFDESDFGWRVCEKGWKAGICTRARTDHYGVIEGGCAPQLRHLGIEKPRRAYFFGRNRLWFAKRHFSFLQICSVMFVFAPLSAAYYGWVALKNRRPDIAWAYLRGTIVGVFTSCRSKLPHGVIVKTN